MFTVLSRRESGSEKCPRCSRVNVDFVDLGEDMLACFDCGSVFLTKKGRVKARVKKPEIKIEVPVTAMEVGLPGEETAAPPVFFTCGTCGKQVKTKLALSGHMRSHVKK